MPKAAGTMKGRPINLEEFERMLASIESVLAGATRNKDDVATDAAGDAWRGSRRARAKKSWPPHGNAFCEVCGSQDCGSRKR